MAKQYIYRISQCWGDPPCLHFLPSPVVCTDTGHRKGSVKNPDPQWGMETVVGDRYLVAWCRSSALYEIKEEEECQ